MTDGPPPQATPDEYFDAQWGGSEDPWSQADRWYETRKFDLTVAALPRPHYRRAFEPGCGAGFLTRRLATRADEVLAMERSATGVDATRRRCADLPGVRVVRGRIPEDWPDATFDLLVVSEVLYYLDDHGLATALDRLATSLAPGGDLVAVHFRPEVPEHARRGDEVHDRLRERFAPAGVHHLEDDFRLEVLRAP